MTGAPTASTFSATHAALDEPAWVGEVWSVFRSLGLAQLAYVPDAGLAGLIRRAEAAGIGPAGAAPTAGAARVGSETSGPAGPSLLRAVPLASEEEGVAVLAGAWLGGQRGALLMQSSGVGNCINMLSLTQTCRFPLLAVVTMRGQWGERNPWQVPMGTSAAAVLRAAGMLVFEVEAADDVAPTVAAAGAMVFSGPAAAAVLIGQRVLGAKAFSSPAPAAGTDSGAHR